MLDLNTKYKSLISSLKKIIPFNADLAIVLGSGLSDFADKLNKIVSIAADELENYPKSDVNGHKGFIHLAEIDNKKILIFQGRAHFYEGFSISDSVLPSHITYKLGCRNLLLTNAAGGINSALHPADLMLIRSFNSIFIKNELKNILRLASVNEKNNILDLTSPYLNNLLTKAALEEKIELKEGTYFYTKGPCYETPAEIKFIKKIGGDAVGMSTAHEAIYAAVKGINVCGLSCITNYGAGISPDRLSHADVIKTGDKTKVTFEKLIRRFISYL